MICFEDTIPQVIGRFFRGADQAHQPDFLVNLSNDGWYPDSSELDMHLAIGVFRTIEHRVPLARAVNTGFSSLVDGNGEIRARLPKNVEDVLIVQVPLDDRTTWYSRWGDWLGLSCLAVTIGWIPDGRSIRPRSAAAPPPAAGLTNLPHFARPLFLPGRGLWVRFGGVAAGRG